MATDASGHVEHAAPDRERGHRQIQCVAVTPERTVLDETVDFVALPLYDGELGVMPGRSPLIARLGFGELRTRAGGATQRYFIDGGFAQVRDNVVTILTNRAIPLPELNPHNVSHELEQARARRAVTDFEYNEKTKAIARARAQLRMAPHKA